MKYLLRTAPLLIGSALVFVLFRHFGLSDLALALRHLDPADLAFYAAFTIVVVFCYAVRWQLVNRSLGREIPLGRLASARLAGDAVGNLIPSARLAGEPVRMAIIRASGVDGAAATAGVAVDRVLETVSNILCGAAYLLIFILTHGVGERPRSIVIAAVLLLVGGLALAVPIVNLRRGVPPFGLLHVLLSNRGGRAHAWLAGLRRLEEHLLKFFRERPAAFVQGLALSILAEALTVCQYHFLLAAFDVRVDLSTLLLALFGTGIAHAVPLPAALGSLEGVEVGVLALAAGDPSLGFVVGLIMRLHDTLISLAGMVALSVHGFSLAKIPPLRPAGETSL